MTKTSYGQRQWQGEGYRNTVCKNHAWKPDQCKQRHSMVKVFTLCNKV